MKKKLTTVAGAPVPDNQNSMTAGPRGPMLLQDVWYLEKLAHFDREVIPERRMHAKGSGAFGIFTVTHDITRYTKAKIFSEVGKKTELFVRFSTVAGERGAADAERDIRGFAMKFYTEEGNWDLVGNNTPVFFLRDPLKFPDLNHAVKRDPRTNLRSARNNWDFWTSLPEALHQVTIVMSDRGIPATYRHMHGFGSHTFSLINADNERFWVKFHLRTPAGHQEPDRRGSRSAGGQGPREPSARPVRGHRARRLPALDDVHPGDAREGRRHLSLPPLRPDQGVVQEGLSPDRGGRDGAEPQPGELLRRRRAGGLQPGQHRARHRLLTGQDAAGAPVLLRRCAALPARRQPPPDPGQRAPRAAAAHSYHRDGQMRVDGNHGGTLGYEPNSYGEWQEQPEFTEPPLALSGAADHWNFREDDDDYYTQPGKLFRLMSPAQQKVLFENTARAMGDAPMEIKLRHIGNCLKADPAYGKGVAKAMGIPAGKLPK